MANISKNFRTNRGFIPHHFSAKSGAGFTQAPAFKSKSGAGFTPLETEARCEPSRSLTGFTMIEILVVMTTVTILTAVVLLYSHQGEAQLILFKERSRLVAEIYRAKALSVETFNQSSVPCGFGIHFVGPQTYILFKDIAANCDTSNNRYSASDLDQIVATTTIDPGVNFGVLPISDILFAPPDPKVYIDGVADYSLVATLPLVSITGTTLDVKINGAGQITI